MPANAHAWCELCSQTEIDDSFLGASIVSDSFCVRELLSFADSPAGARCHVAAARALVAGRGSRTESEGVQVVPGILDVGGLAKYSAAAIVYERIKHSEASLLVQGNEL